MAKNPLPMQETYEMQLRFLGPEDSPGEGNGNPLQYSCLGNPMGRGTWRATVHGVVKGQTRLSASLTQAHTHTHTHTPLNTELVKGWVGPGREKDPPVLPWWSACTSPSGAVFSTLLP